jgi:hypothetical protein
MTMSCYSPTIAIPPCVGSELARTFFTLAEWVGAPVCSAFQCGYVVE